MSAQISIITPVYNARPFLSQLYTSVMRQGLTQQLEWLLIDDASVDGSRHIIEAWAKKHHWIRLLCHDHNRGVAAARNTGLNAAHGCYIAFLDADDLWLPEKLSTQLAFMEQHHILLSHMDYLRHEVETNHKIAVRAAGQLQYTDMLKGNGIGMLSAMVHRNLIGATRFTHQGHEDYLFWLTLMHQHAATAQRCPTVTPLCIYRVSRQSLSADKWRAAKWQWHILRQNLGLTLVKSVWYFCCYANRAVRKRIG